MGFYSSGDRQRGGPCPGGGLGKKWAPLPNGYHYPIGSGRISYATSQDVCVHVADLPRLGTVCRGGTAKTVRWAGDSARYRSRNSCAREPRPRNTATRPIPFPERHLTHV